MAVVKFPRWSFNSYHIQVALGRTQGGSGCLVAQQPLRSPGTGSKSGGAGCDSETQWGGAHLKLVYAELARKGRRKQSQALETGETGRIQRDTSEGWGAPPDGASPAPAMRAQLGGP